jgi:hypothetical protein
MSSLMEKHEYRPLTDEEGESSPPHFYLRENPHTKLITIACFVVAVITTSFGGFFAGRVYATKQPGTFKPTFKEPVKCKDVSNRTSIPGC